MLVFINSLYDFEQYHVSSTFEFALMPAFAQINLSRVSPEGGFAAAVVSGYF